VVGPSPPYALNVNVTLNCSTRLTGNVIWSVNEFQLNNERRLAVFRNEGVIVQQLEMTWSVITINSQPSINTTRFRCEVEGPGALDGIIGQSEFINFTNYGELF